MKIKSFLSGLVFALLLAGCVEGPPSGNAPDLTFANFTPVNLNVASIEVRNDYKPPMREPNVEHLFKTPPYTSAENLVRKQIVAAGTEHILRVVIEEASVVREELPVTKGFWGKLTEEPSERLKAKVSLRFELVDVAAPDIILGHAEVLAKRNKMLMEGISLADRDRAYFSLTEDLMDDLNDGLMTVVKNTFGTPPG